MSELFSLFPGLFDKLPIEAKDFSDEVEKIIKKHEKGGGYVSLHYIYSLFRTTGYIFCLSVILGSTSLISDWTCWRSLISSASDMIVLISRRREGLTFKRLERQPAGKCCILTSNIQLFHLTLSILRQTPSVYSNSPRIRTWVLRTC